MKKSTVLTYTVYIQTDIHNKVSKTVLISQKIAKKLLKKHQVKAFEIIQCFKNNAGKYLQDTREVHKTDPPTLWFISETNACRRLKIVFIPYTQSEYILKTAYKPSSDEEKIYKYYGRKNKKN